MQTLTSNTRTEMPARRAGQHATQPLWLRALNWLARADNAYRQKQMLKSLPDERLEDMGLSRRDADIAFYRRGSN
jgi:uncharacterized protein YjiS (DUF1127 family)